MLASLTRLSLGLGLLALLAPAAAAQFNGSVYTTDSKAGVENVFSNPKAVYMAGGPGPNAGCSSNGLPDGTYYFQVTDPSGATLLSTDPIASRALTVSGGVIVAASGKHGTRNGPCGSSIVQLAPFDPSPNSSGEYKVWLTPELDYVAGGANHGFLSGHSKTDNFKVRGGGQPQEQALIEGTVFYDYNQNGVYDPSVPDEVPIPGWRVEIDSGGIVEIVFTDMDGHYEFIRDAFTTHVLSSVAPDPFYVGVPGGRWVATSDTVVSAIATPPSVTVDFGKLHMVNTPELALSPGYWHNQGKSTLQANDPSWRVLVNGLCLRDNFTVPFPPPTPDPTLFTVSETADFDTAFAQLSGFLTSSKYGILANILSVHYCAQNLNKFFGNLQQITYIDRFGDDVLVNFDEMAAGTLGLLCDPRSCDTGPDGDPIWRAKVQGCLTEWTTMSSGGENVYTAENRPPVFISPY